MSDQAAGIVYLVGAGPGRPRPADPPRGATSWRGPTWSSTTTWPAPGCSTSPRASAVRICAGKSIGHCTLTQAEINAPAGRARAARAGRWSGSRGATRTSSAGGPRRPSTSAPTGVAFEVVPGVTAGVGVTAYAGVPVTHRDAASAVAFVTGHDDPEVRRARGRLDWAALARFPGTLVVYMGVTRLEALCRTLVRQGKPADDPRRAGRVGHARPPADRRRHARRPRPSGSPRPGSGRPRCSSSARSSPAGRR